MRSCDTSGRAGRRQLPRRQSRSLLEPAPCSDTLRCVLRFRNSFVAFFALVVFVIAAARTPVAHAAESSKRAELSNSRAVTQEEDAATDSPTPKPKKKATPKPEKSPSPTA